MRSSIMAKDLMGLTNPMSEDAETRDKKSSQSKIPSYRGSSQAR